jgi:hypothetical protein
MLFIDGKVVDYDLDLLVDVLEVLGKHLVLILQHSAVDPELADQFGDFDRAEHVTGLAFAACQTYLTATCGHVGVSKDRALAVGPLHPSGRRVVSIINHVANYWKHKDEWGLDRDKARQNRIAAAFDAIGFPVGAEYPLSGILTELCSPAEAAFSSLVPLLVAWRDDARDAFGAKRPTRRS